MRFESLLVGGVDFLLTREKKKEKKEIFTDLQFELLRISST